MKDIITFINETINDINKYYVNIDDLKDGDNLILGWVDDDNISHPMNVIFKKHGKEFTFVNPDDDRDMIDWHDFINSTDDNENPQIAVFKNMKEADKFCKYYNNISEM